LGGEIFSIPHHLLHILEKSFAKKYGWILRTASII